MDSRPKDSLKHRDIAVLVSAALLALGSFFLDDFLVICVFLIISWAGFVYVCFDHLVSLNKRAVSVLLVTAIYGVTVLLLHKRQLKRDSDDVYEKLAIQPFIPKSGNVLRTGITVTNGGRVNINKEHQIQCYLRRITYAPYGGIDNITTMTTFPEQVIWRAYGGGETSYCIAGIQSFLPDTHAICADVTVTVLYALESQPELKKSKPLRFVATGEDFTYRPQTVDYPGDYCPELRFPPQAPFH